MEKETLKKRAAVGVVVLGVKRVLIQVVYTISNIFLARILFPQDFGSFAIATFVVIFFTVFADLGLGPSLVQKKEKIAETDLQTVFTFQLLLILGIYLLIFITAPAIASFYKFTEVGVTLLRVYPLYLFFIPFKTTSGAILERNLNYSKLVTIEVLEIAATSTITVIFAFLGAGVLSFAAGAVIGHLLGAALYFRFSPWPLTLAIYKKNLTKLAKFGLPFQSQVWLGLFFGPLILLYLGKVVGSSNLGYYQFAASLSAIPAAVSEIINRIVFPLGARTQEDKAFLRQIIERSVVIISFTSLPIVAVIMAAAPQIVHFVYTNRWLPSLPAIYLTLLQMGVIAYTGVFAQLLLSLGFAKVMRNISAFWAVLTWIAAPPLIYFFNFVGMSLAGLLISATGIWLIFRLKREVNFSFLPNFSIYFLNSVISGLTAFILMKTLPNTFASLVLTLFFSGFCYLVLSSLFVRKSLLENFKFLIAAFRTS